MKKKIVKIKEVLLLNPSHFTESQARDLAERLQRFTILCDVEGLASMSFSQIEKLLTMIKKEKKRQTSFLK